MNNKKRRKGLRHYFFHSFPLGHKKGVVAITGNIRGTVFP